MSTKTKIKSKAQAYAPQSKDECAADIAKLGALQRNMVRSLADMNDEISKITQQHQPGLEALQAQIDTLQKGVQTWCEAHRTELTNDGKVKTANLVTGEVNWRSRPASVGIRGAETVIETFRRLGLTRFIRPKDEVNKEAILADPDAVRGVAGVTIVKGIEDFVITPFEQEAS